MLMGDILAQLETIPAMTPNEIEMKRRAVSRIQKVRNRVIHHPHNMVKNIRDILKAIQVLQELAPGHAIRFDLDRLLALWEEQWYLAGLIPP